MDNVLEIKKLKKIYHTKEGETKAIEDFSFDLKEGEFVAIVGPSGCGKSTILSVLCGLEEKSGGEISLKKDSSVGYMLQQDSLFEWRNDMNYLDKIKELSLPIIEEHNMVLISVKLVKEFGASIIQITIDDPKTFNLDIDEVAKIN